MNPTNLKNCHLPISLPNFGIPSMNLSPPVKCFERLLLGNEQSSNSPIIILNTVEKYYKIKFVYWIPINIKILFLLGNLSGI